MSHKNTGIILEEQEACFHAVTQWAGSAIISTDCSGKIVAWNKGAQIIFGYSKDEILGKSMLCLIPERFQKVHEEGFARFRNWSGATSGEKLRQFHGLKKDGAEFPTEISMSVWKHGDEIFYTGILHDVTERTRAEEQLRKLSRAVEQSPALVIITDTRGNIEYVNPKFTQLTGYSFAEVKEKNASILKSGETPQSEYRKLWDTITSGAEWRGEFHNKKKNGELYWESASISPIRNSAGVITHFVAVKEDITQRKQTENELCVSRQQLRNLSKHLQDARENERKHVAREIHDELGQLLSLLKIDLFWIEKHKHDSEKLFSDKIQTMAKTIDLAIQTVQEISRELRPSMLDNLGLIPAIEWQTTEFENRTGIKCKTKLQIEEIELSSEVSIATFRVLQEALTNIVRHAQATRVEVRLDDKPNEIVLKIKDNGKGITEEQIADPGSFGLIGIKERIRCLNGTIKISGKPGKGSCVLASIPHENFNGDQSG